MPISPTEPPLAMAANPPSQGALALIESITKLGQGLQNGEQGAREGLLGAASKLIAELSHPSETMLHLLWAQPSHLSVIRMGVEIKLFQAMQGIDAAGKTTAEIASRTDPKTDPVLVGRMLRHLAAMHTVNETAPDTFAPTATSKSFAEPVYQDTILYIIDNFQPAHQKLPGFFQTHGFTSPNSQTDGPFQHAFDCKGYHYFEYFQKFDQEMGRRFGSMMDAWSKGRPRWFEPEFYPVKEHLIEGAESEGVFLVDIGGGVGHDVEGVRQAFGSALPGKLVLQDRPEVIEHAQVGTGVEARAHDFLTEQPVQGARAYYLHSIIQDWSDDVNMQILKAIVPAMKKGYSKVLVNDFVVPDQGAAWPQTALDWELMASLGARHRTVAEHTKLYQGAGLKINGIWRHPHSLDSLIELELA